MPSTCSDLIGLRYRLGADGSNGEIDCINLCYRALEMLGIPAPAFKQSWYESGKWQILRDLLTWGVRVDSPAYDGDILLLQQDTWAFAVTWQTGILYINRQLERVAWCSVQSLGKNHCFRTKDSLLS